jgi:hypothetical protein
MEEERQEEDPKDRFSQGWPHYNINAGVLPSIKAGFMPRPISRILRAPARTSPMGNKKMDSGG